VQHAADAKGVALRFESAHPEPFYGDPARVQQIVWNLVNNAVKFTPGGGQVEITVARAPDQLELRVSDTGEGIHAEFLPHLFERFRQADSSASRRHGGLGLGLAITRQLVELHGGTIEAQSPGQGAGATFVVRFPISAERAWLATADASPTRSSSSASSEALRGVRVMLVDDENDTREALVLALARAGAEVTAFADAASALRAFAAGPPDVLVSDIGMPDTDGYEFMQQIAAIRARSGTSTPAIALTAYARDADIERARAAGYDLHVPKPVDMNALVERVASLARRG
jgi:CheY-like chemotaxis protein